MYGPLMKYGPLTPEERANLLGSISLASGHERETVDRLYGFALILRAACLMPDDEDGYWERPWKWDIEYRAWLRHDCPEEGDAGFAAFVEEATVLTNP